MKTLRILTLAVLCVSGSTLAKQPVLVITVDGMDQRYLTDSDRLGLKIPNLRKLMREGQWSAGVVGVVPTVTYPSHTTILTGVEATEHGILANSLPDKDGNNRYWSTELLKVKTLLDAAHESGLKTGSVNWPVTVGAISDFNLPKVARKTRGYAQDLRTVSSKANPPDLVNRVNGMFPSFRREWFDDRSRTLAVRYLLKAERPDFLIVNLGDHDETGHVNGPFTPEALAALEYLDELIGTILLDVPKDYAVLVLSDHGFEKWDREVNLGVVAAQRGVKGIRSLGYVVVADDAEAAKLLAELRQDPQYGIGREVPREEIQRFSPDLLGAAAVYEPAPAAWFGSATSGEVVTKPADLGRHGYWPTRYRAAYLAWGAGIRPERIAEMSLKDVAGRIATLLGIPFKPGVPRVPAGSGGEP